MEQDTTPFSNTALDIEHLPDYSAVDLQSVAPQFSRYVLYSTLMYWLPILLLALAARWLPFISSSYDYLLAAPVAVLALSIYWYRLADMRHRGWALREHDLIAQSGVWWRSTITLPMARIQHVETSNGPLERKLGLARLSCYTAGGITADLVVIGLNVDMADQLREHLLEQIRQRDAQARSAEAHQESVSASGAEPASVFEPDGEPLPVDSVDDGVAVQERIETDQQRSQQTLFSDTETAGAETDSSAQKPHD